MNDRCIGDAADPATRVGPLIDGTAFKHITQQLAGLPNGAQFLQQLSLGLVAQGVHFCAPANHDGCIATLQGLGAGSMPRATVARTDLLEHVGTRGDSELETDLPHIMRGHPFTLTMAMQPQDSRVSYAQQRPAVEVRPCCESTNPAFGFIHHVQTRSGTS